MKNLSKCQETMTIQQEISLDYSYHQNYYKVIGIYSSRQTSTIIPQQINFTVKLEDNGAIMFFIDKK